MAWSGACCAPYSACNMLWGGRHPHKLWEPHGGGVHGSLDAWGGWQPSTCGKSRSQVPCDEQAPAPQEAEWRIGRTLQDPGRGIVRDLWFTLAPVTGRRQVRFSHGSPPPASSGSPSSGWVTWGWAAATVSQTVTEHHSERHVLSRFISTSVCFTYKLAASSHPNSHQFLFLTHLVNYYHGHALRRYHIAVHSFSLLRL